MRKTYRIDRGMYRTHPKIKILDVLSETNHTITFMCPDLFGKELYKDKEYKETQDHAHFVTYAEARRALLEVYDKKIAQANKKRDRLLNERMGVYVVYEETKEGKDG